MPRPPKIHLPKTAVWVNSSIEQGILLPPTPVINTILRSALAHAQDLYPVKVCDLIVSTNHVHKVLLVENPNDVKDFMCAFKTESAHAINHLLGRKKRTVWCAGYDSPVFLTPGKLMDKLVYTYTNPAKDSLVDSVKHYPGLNSYQALKSKQKEVIWNCKYIRRPAVPEIGTKHYTYSQLRQIAHELEDSSTETLQFKLHPYAWLEAFDMHDDKEILEEVREELLTRIKDTEAKYQRERTLKGHSAFGAKELSTRALETQYLPDRKGRRTICLGPKILRKPFIGNVREKQAESKEVQERWKLGDYSRPYPTGLYPPSLPRRIENIPYMVPPLARYHSSNFDGSIVIDLYQQFLKEEHQDQDPPIGGTKIKDRTKTKNLKNS